MCFLYLGERKNVWKVREVGRMYDPPSPFNFMTAAAIMESAAFRLFFAFLCLSR